MLGWHQAQPSHELARVGEPGEVAHLGHQRRRDDQLDALQGLQSRDDRRKRPGRDQLGELLLELSLPALCLVEAIEVALQGKLLRGMREPPVREPDTMPEPPRLSEVADAMLEQEHLDVRPGLAHIVGRRLPGADEIAHRLVNLSGTQTKVSSPARRSRARVTASRVSFLIRSPGLRGVRDGATTRQARPEAVRWR